MHSMCGFQITWPTVSENDDVKEIQMLYKFNYLPPGLFNRAQVGDKKRNGERLESEQWSLCPT